MKCILSIALLLTIYVVNAQSLIINEVSNGAVGSEEYVELLVVGTPSCGVNATLDIRNYYIDDNNGSHAPGSGTGIATGCVRFKNNIFWQNIPIGTLILIYNNLDKNSSITLADDASMTDGNGRLIIPISHTLLETNTLTPIASGTSAYPTTGFTSGGNWNTVGMANSDDSFHTVDDNGNIIFAVSYNNNNLNNDIYFAASQGGKVIYNANTVNNTFTNQANWVNVTVAGNETPGTPNNAANATWINSMTTTPTPLTLTATKNNAVCSCNGSISISPNGAASPYSYTWSPAVSTTNTATNLCGGNYTITVNSANGCSQSTIVTISSSSSNSVSVNSETICAGVSTILTASPSAVGGTFAWLPNGETTQTISVSPTSSSTYAVTYSLSGCSSSATSTVSIKAIPVLNLTTSANTICPNQTATLTASGGTEPYTWSNSSTNTTSISTTTGGSVTVSYTNICGTLDTKSIIVNVTNLNASFSANPQSGVKPLVVSFTNNSSASATNYTWTLGNGTVANSQTVSAQSYTNEGSYMVYLSITDGNCFDKDSLIITVLSEEPVLVIPNVFTPNGDAINDVFKINGLNITTFNCAIFDRWGLQLFEWSDATKGWDGKVNGKMATDGTYFYIINATDNTGKEIKQQGSVNLFR